eukprot:TRINITY_DN8076_c0_g1_i1.p1 TRINITY_DN8076_c0_g1~~TRINITY_DN8076_c0_g1_i1.p1  ORF type:complete len:550 (-),score=108.43 TRINITY_DN8076_c0_g1_i1:60-1709(-)
MKITIDTQELSNDYFAIFAGILTVYYFLVYSRSLHRKVFASWKQKRTDRSKVKPKNNGDKSPSSSSISAPGPISAPPSSNGILQHKEIANGVMSSSPAIKKARIGLRLSPEGGQYSGKVSSTTGQSGSKGSKMSMFSASNGDINNDYEISYSRPSSKVRLEWVSKPKTVLIIKKWKDEQVTSCVAELVRWMHTEYPQIQLMVEPDTYEELVESMSEINFIVFDKSLADQEADQVDLILCLGGDGTVLYISSLFQFSVPPIMAFGLGSMGFLTPFNFKTFRDDLKPVLRGRCFIKLRLRLSCTIIRNGQLEPETEYHALNEATIDRGASPYLSHLDCYCDDKLITTVQADGIIVATATGSTAYSLSSGGSLVHPLLPALLFTPICPHSLSFRPVVLPSSCSLKVMIPKESHGSGSISFDGRGRQELFPGDGVLMKISEWPVATVSKSDQIAEWFSSLAQHLNWNKRVIQKKKETPSTVSEKEREKEREKDGPFVSVEKIPPLVSQQGQSTLRRVSSEEVQKIGVGEADQDPQIKQIRRAESAAFNPRSTL